MSKLINPPLDDRSRELWLQHAAGFMLFRDMKEYAVDNIPADVDESTRRLIVNGIEDAIYGLMMMMDGVTEGLKNDKYSIRLESNIVLEKNGEVIENINTFDGDGMCMGFHEWKEGSFGDDDLFEATP